MRTAFLFGWPPGALTFAYCLALLEGIWGDPWYGFNWSSDLEVTALYLVGAPLSFAICVAWCVTTLVLAVWRPVLWSRPRVAFTAIGFAIGAPILAMAMLLLGGVMRVFFGEAFRY